MVVLHVLPNDHTLVTINIDGKKVSRVFRFSANIIDKGYVRDQERLWIYLKVKTHSRGDLSRGDLSRDNEGWSGIQSLCLEHNKDLKEKNISMCDMRENKR